MQLLRSLKHSFGFLPERSRRFFRLRINLKKDIPLSEGLQEEHQSMLGAAEEQGQVLFAARSTKEEAPFYEYLFQSPNQVEPFHFYKQTPFLAHGLVDDYSIKQIELQLKVKDKELAPAYLRE